MNTGAGDRADGHLGTEVDLVAAEDRQVVADTVALVSGALAALSASYTRALPAVIHLVGPDHHEVPKLRRQMAEVETVRQQPVDVQASCEDLERLLHRALITFEGVLGSESVEVAACSHELARLLANRGRGDEARWLYERALRIRRRVLGAGHPDVATTLHNLALLHEAEGRVDEAMARWREAREALSSAPQPNS
jgi:hypothetical protein